MLEEKFNEELKTALKGRDAVKASVIRMLKADIGNTAIRSGKNTLTDEEIIKVIQKQIKQHQDSIEQFKNGNRQDLVDKESKELDILKGYVPEQVSDAELESAVKAVIEELKAVSKKEMGLVIKAVLEKLKGRADGRRVSQIAQNLLK